MFFQSEPDLKWTRKNCEYCMGPIGPKSGCENIKIKGTPPNNTFSPSCPNKNGYGWIIDFNYPASLTLINAIKDIRGIDTIFPISPYRVEIRIATLADEAEVKRSVATTYKNLIKSVQTLVDKPIPTSVTIIVDDNQIDMPIASETAEGVMAAIEDLAKAMPKVVSYVYNYDKN